MGEPDEDESEKRGFVVSEDLVQSPTHKQATTTETNLDGLLANNPLKLHEDLSKGNGGQAWPAGYVLAKYLLRTKRHELQDCSSIVELGAGGGLVGLAIALGCKPRGLVHITDQASMLSLMESNISLNDARACVHASVYEWGTERPEAIPSHPDIVLAADCVYFEPAFPLLLGTLEDLLGPNSVCYFCFKKRRRADMTFLKAAKKVLAVEEITDDPDRENYVRESIFLCTMRLKPTR